MQKTAMRGEKIFYTEKRRRHRHAREIFFHREAVKISSGGKNPGQFTQTEVIPIIFYTFTTKILIFILIIQNNYIPLHWNSTRTPNNSTHKPATRLKTKKNAPSRTKTARNTIYFPRKCYICSKKKDDNAEPPHRQKRTKHKTHTLKKAKQNEEAPHPFSPAACL